MPSDLGYYHKTAVKFPALFCFPGFFFLAGLLAFQGCTEGNDNPELANRELYTDISTEANLNMVHEPCVDGAYHMPESIGSGCALLDYDNDNDLDIYMLNGAWRGPDFENKPVVKNRLFEQQTTGTFVEVTDHSGLGDTGYGMGVAVGDIDNDGFSDLYISNDGPDALYRNNGDGTFENITESAGISNDAWGCSAAFLDFNNDDFLDVFVVNYVRYDPDVPCIDKAGRRDYCGPSSFPGIPDKLFKNNGDGTFSDVSLASGIGNVAMKGLGVICADFNNDSYTDVYVANDGEPNCLWINKSDGSFEDQALVLGCALNELGQGEASMGVTVGDADNDGDLDLFMTHLRGETNTFYSYADGIGFLDDTALAGLGVVSLNLTGFGTGFLDFDSDGYLDLAVVNGRVTRGPLMVAHAKPGYWDDYAEPNLLFRNMGNGRFQDYCQSATAFCGTIENSRGLAFGDIDNDGDIDLLVANAGGRARLYRNDNPHKGNWLTVRAIDPVLNRDAYGATIRLYCDMSVLVKSVNPGFSFLSSNDPRLHFGLGKSTKVERLEVRWPDGKLETFAITEINRQIVLKKGEGILSE